MYTIPDFVFIFFSTGNYLHLLHQTDMSHAIMLIYLMTRHTREGTICMHILITGRCMCLLIILIYEVFFDGILHHSKNIVKSRMNMGLQTATVTLPWGVKHNFTDN